MRFIIAPAAFVIVLTTAILLSPIQADAQTFQPPINLSNNAGDPEDQQIVANDSILCVVWADNTAGNFEILFRRSTDGGSTWGSTLNLSNSPTSSRFPHIALSGGTIFVVWDEFSDFNAPHKITFSRSTDNGATFEPPQKLSDDSSEKHCGVNIAAGGSLVFPYWSVCGTEVMHFQRSVNAGATFEPQQLFTSGGGDTSATKWVVSGSNVYSLASSLSSNALLFRSSSNSGVTFNAPQTIWPTTVYNVDMVASGNNTYVTWQPQPQFNNPNVLFSRSVDNGATFSSPLIFQMSLATLAVTRQASPL